MQKLNRKPKSLNILERKSLHRNPRFILSWKFVNLAPDFPCVPRLVVHVQTSILSGGCKLRLYYTYSFIT